MSDDYVFTCHADSSERARLQTLEVIHDPCTRRALERLGLAKGQSCAEVGAGAGSIARHMAEVVGSAGRVTALDLNPRFLSSSGLTQLEVRQGDVTGPDPLEPESYDLIHARFVLLHLSDPGAALRNLWRALKPGGALLVEEPDFRTAFSAATDQGVGKAVDAVNGAIVVMYQEMGLDLGFGLRLPALLLDQGSAEPEIETTTPLARGGSPMAMMMGASVAHLRAKLVATCGATDVEVDAYCAAASDASVWASYYMTVSAAARK